VADNSPRRSTYDAVYIAQHYDTAGEREWERFDRRLSDRVSLEIHRRLLADFVHPGDRVLDAGAGPGRFTIEIARLGATVVVGDISPEQLRLNAEKLAEAGLEEKVEAREEAVVCDLRAPPLSADPQRRSSALKTHQPLSIRATCRQIDPAVAP
jgi:2-polyprenyl-3-methyl-5-hydroxy-6-metoxy-1,4-benzoquinol methylase